MKSRRLLAALLALAALGGVGAWAWARVTDGEGPGDAAFRQACDLPEEIIERIARGHQTGRSEDVSIVPAAPNYVGSFELTSHSGPWDYLQRVPLVAYGPGRVPSSGSIQREATLADVYPTVQTWTGTRLEPREGAVLREAVEERSGPPKLLVFVMWDGVGRNVLERWPDRWPTLARLEREGTSYPNATVGSSPSITPSTHATLGTGTFPREHGITGIHYRGPDGDIRTAFGRRQPNDLDLTTFADQLDLALGNAPKVGLLGLRIWHIPMMGHGTATPGGDRDHLGIIGFDEKISGNRQFYETPTYLKGFGDLHSHIDDVDLEDGVRDGRWRGHEIAADHDNPAWARYQTDVLLEMWERGGYGRDEVPDLFFVNFKMTDIVGHKYTMDSEEMGDMLAAQDDALADMVGYLEREVGDYVLVLSADHGHTPSPEGSRAWPISAGELENDINEHFEVPDDSSLLEQRSAVGFFIDDEVARAAGTSPGDIAGFVAGYTLRENWPGSELPDGYESRGDERVFAAAFPSTDILDCAKLF